MVNMNHYEDPAIYGLTDPDGGVFYIGRTSVNTQNRWWEHRSRARSGHTAPVYVRIREIGVERFGWTVIERFADIPEGITPREREAWWIAEYLRRGHSLVNSDGRDGRPDSWDERRREAGIPERRGKSTWVKGKTGEDAGWTAKRKENQARAVKMRQWAREIGNPDLLAARVERMERREQMDVQRQAAKEYYGLPVVPRSLSAIPRHGTRTMWEKYKCKCQPCRDAGARHNAKKRGKADWESVTATTRDASQRKHGTPAMYKHGGCRCDDCRAAHRIQARDRRVAQSQITTVE
jgi:hypothetical protein